MGVPTGACKAKFTAGQACEKKLDVDDTTWSKVCATGLTCSDKKKCALDPNSPCTTTSKADCGDEKTYQKCLIIKSGVETACATGDTFGCTCKALKTKGQKCALKTALLCPAAAPCEKTHGNACVAADEEPCTCGPAPAVTPPASSAEKVSAAIGTGLATGFLLAGI